MDIAVSPSIGGLMGLGATIGLDGVIYTIDSKAYKKPPNKPPSYYHIVVRTRLTVEQVADTLMKQDREASAMLLHLTDYNHLFRQSKIRNMPGVNHH